MKKTLFLACLGGSMANVAARQSVPLYDMVEESIVNNTPFSNPFTETELRLTTYNKNRRQKY